jgi:hypothetical protein
MKRLVSWLMGGVLLAGLLLGLVMAPSVQAAELRNLVDDKIAESGGKIDLNNCSVRRFQVYPGMYPTLAFERVSSVQSQSNFEDLRVSSVKSRLKRSSSITTCVMDLLRAPSMIHRTPSMEMLEDFQKLEVQTDATDNMPSMFHRPTSTEMHEDCQKLKGQGSQTLDHGLFHPRSSLFLFQNIEIYDA